MTKDEIFVKDTEKEFQVVFESMQYINNRKNNDDKKILKFIEHFIKDKI